NALTWDDEYFPDPPRKVHDRWYQVNDKFLHLCGTLGDKRKRLSGWVVEEKCSCCGRRAPEQISVLIKLQQLNT
ncbi:MAG: hypothetical protein ACXABY_14410, partial [Candidatus Thorarchaeota archaeon]